MFDASSRDVELSLARSRRLAIVVLLVHGGALAILFAVPLAWWWRSLIAAFVALSAYLTVVHHVSRSAGAAIVAFVMEEGDRCRWRYRRSAEWVRGRVIDRWVHAPLTLLKVRADDEWRARSVVIPADAVAAQPFRRLRVRLTVQSGAE